MYHVTVTYSYNLSILSATFVIPAHNRAYAVSEGKSRARREHLVDTILNVSAVKLG